MKNQDRYKTSHLSEAQYEPGSRNRVLKNLLGVKLKREMEQVETEYFAAVQAGMDNNYKPMEAIFDMIISKTLKDQEL